MTPLPPKNFTTLLLLLFYLVIALFLLGMILAQGHCCTRQKTSNNFTTPNDKFSYCIIRFPTPDVVHSITNTISVLWNVIVYYIVIFFMNKQSRNRISKPRKKVFSMFYIFLAFFWFDFLVLWPDPHDLCGSRSSNRISLGSMRIRILSPSVMYEKFKVELV